MYRLKYLKSKNYILELIFCAFLRILEWYPPGRKRKERLRNSWMQEVTTRMREKEWIDRKRWRRKIK